MDNMTLAAVAAMVLTQAADILTTERAIRRGGTEGNPVVAWAMRRFGRGWMVAKALAAAAITYWMIQTGDVWVIWAVAVITGAVAINNWRISK